MPNHIISFNTDIYKLKAIPIGWLKAGKSYIYVTFEQHFHINVG
jgi:hypothetical protein